MESELLEKKNAKELAATPKKKAGDLQKVAKLEDGLYSPSHKFTLGVLAHRPHGQGDYVTTHKKEGDLSSRVHLVHELSTLNHKHEVSDAKLAQNLKQALS